MTVGPNPEDLAKFFGWLFFQGWFKKRRFCIEEIFNGQGSY